jgi:hypothetical protein
LEPKITKLSHKVAIVISKIKEKCNKNKKIDLFNLNHKSKNILKQFKKKKTIMMIMMLD